MQLMYLATPADCAAGRSLQESYSFVEMQLVYLATPDNWAI